MIHGIDDFDTCEGRDGADSVVEVRPVEGPDTAATLTPGAPVMRLWTIWDIYQKHLIDGLA